MDKIIMVLGLIGLGVASNAVIAADPVPQVSVSQSAHPLPGPGLAPLRWQGRSARDYMALAANLTREPGAATYHYAHQAAARDAPEGFTLDDPLVDPGNSQVIYTSQDGRFFAAGGRVYAIEEYPGRIAIWGGGG